MVGVGRHPRRGQNQNARVGPDLAGKAINADVACDCVYNHAVVVGTAIVDGIIIKKIK